MRKTKLRPNSYENFFAEPFHYSESFYGYAVAASSEDDAIRKYMEYFGDWPWITSNSRKYLAADLRSNLKNCWVRWQGFQDDNGDFYNGWVITTDYHGGDKRWRHVYSSNYEEHYVKKGHHFEAQPDENGRKRWYSDCNVCGSRQ